MKRKQMMNVRYIKKYLEMEGKSSINIYHINEKKEPVWYRGK